jgi:hypothetical protein
MHHARIRSGQKIGTNCHIKEIQVKLIAHVGFCSPARRAAVQPFTFR